MLQPDSSLIEQIIQIALEEDLSTAGDVTTKSIFPPETQAEAVIRAKEKGILAGTYLIQPLFRKLDPTLTVAIEMNDGTSVETGSIICRLKGPIHAILAGERTVLNLLQRLSGIATRTSAMVTLVKGTGTRILDTRKTTPGLRMLEKAAVASGGGTNHRIGLYDMILIKDTHVKAARGVANAIRQAKEYRNNNENLKIEAEVQSVEEFHQALAEQPDRIMLDNMSLQDMRACVDHIRDNGLATETEASGNITEETIRAVAETGVDFISSGSLTHSVRALDIHLLVEG